MFLAIREIKHNKLHYGLIIGMVALIGYLTFMLMGLMFGLANENTAAIKSWDTRTVYLNSNANDNLAQSTLTKQQIGKLTDHEALVGTTPAVLKKDSGKQSKQSVQFMALDRHQYIYRQKLQLTAGHKPRHQNEVLLDDSLKEKGYQVGSQIKLNSSSATYRVAGFAKNAQLNIAPLVIGSFSIWHDLKGTNNQYVASGIFADRVYQDKHHDQLTRYTVNEFINKLPGYSAQNITFEFMIGFLMVISLVIITVFLYILTMQKLSEYAVLRAQGIPVSTLIKATFAEALILMAAGALIGLVVTFGTSLVIPNAVPMYINWPLTGLMGLGLIVLGTIGALLPVRIIAKIDPLDAI